MTATSSIDHRVQCDFEIHDDLAAYLVSDMRLLMVSEVRILSKTIIVERHKRPRMQPGRS